MASEATRDFLLVIALLIGLGIAWYATGGPERSAARGGILLNQPKIGSGQAYTVPGVAMRHGTSTSGGEDSDGGGTTVWSTFTNYFGTFSEERSPYSGYVTLERSRADSKYADEYVTIRISKSAPQKITLSDWKLESTMSLVGVKLGNASFLPIAGQVNAENVLAVNPGSVIYVSTGRSPVGVGFRTNLCTGYFEQFQDFDPSLKLECPRPEDEAERVLPFGNYTEECENYVGDIDRCEVTFSSIPGNVGGACYNFIQNDLTYNACVSAHQQEPNFYRDE
ncbi:MAG: hypothetical protein AAB955_00495, partial [Patescibacteria group bacterium]